MREDAAEQRQRQSPSPKTGGAGDGGGFARNARHRECGREPEHGAAARSTRLQKACCRQQRRVRGAPLADSGRFRE